MIQSGTGQFQNMALDLNGKPQTISQTIKFPKPFSNPPVIVLNIIGAGSDFAASGYTISDNDDSIVHISNNDSKVYKSVLHLIKRYLVTSANVTNEGFDANLEAFPVNIPFSPRIDFHEILINFSWIAYDEVTIGA